MSDIDTYATQILETCTSDTASALVAWAMGCRVLGHARHFYRLPLVPAQVSPVMMGGSLGSGRWYEATAARAIVYSGSIEVGGGRDVHATVTWRAVCDLVTPTRVGPDLHGRIVDAMNRRRALTVTGPAVWARQASDEDIARDHERNDVEQLCADLADDVWDRCRPTRLEQVVQLDLLDGLL